MLGTFGTLSPKVKLHYGKVRLDNAVFRLHYKLTTIFLIGACIIVTSSQYIGDPIQCIMNGQMAPGAINTYCWISSTFSVVGSWNGKVGEEVIQPGVGPIHYHMNPETGQLEPEEIKQHAYYQWVPFVLFLQGLMFYLPHWLWKNFDGGRVRGVVATGCAYSMKDEDRKEKRKFLTQYMSSYIRTHNFWYLQFVFCEILNLVNVIGNIFFTDAFLGYEFTKFGIQVASFLEDDPESRTDPMTRVFPRVTKCTWHEYGYSGTIQAKDALCVLAWNIINEKIYVFLWFWFVILAIITGLSLIYRIATMLCQPLRARVLRLNDSAAREEVDSVLSKCRIGDWYFLHHVSSNMDPRDFRDFLQMLAEELKVGGGMEGVCIQIPCPSAPEKMG